jgi:class 3 adenylate cyclase/predicted ATPase
VQSWLEEIGLGHHAQLFAQNRIDLDILPNLTEADLAELGLPLGDRKRLMHAIVAYARTTNRADAGVAARRQLTVMFCDMVGSTELTWQFDPEVMRNFISAYREICVRSIDNYDGYVAQYRGDGVLAYFGYPQAHEDDAERAVRAGLEIVAAISSQSTAFPGPAGADPAVRIAIATGLVVVGDVIGDSTEERDAVVGEAPNLAARLQELAPRNGVVISAATRTLLKETFEFEDLGRRVLKGLPTPVGVWRVVRPRSNDSRFEATAGVNLTPLVGREEEIALLAKRWHLAKEGDGQVVVLSGEPGIGKSRVVQEFRRLASGDMGKLAAFQCSPYHTGTAFYPFSEHLKSAIGFGHTSSTEALLDNLEATIEPAAGMSVVVMQAIASLVGLTAPDRYPPLDVSPQRQKADTVDALVDYLAGLARDRPAVLIFEDCHWIDPTSREVLDLLVDLIQKHRALLIITCRPEFQPSWSAQSHITTLTLNRFSRKAGRAMIEGAVGGRLLPEEIVEAIVAKTDGIPLFIEEVTTSVLESGLVTKQAGRYVLSMPLRQLAIPTTLADSLMARLDRLASFKEIAQIGATIGREFSYELLHAVALAPWEQIDGALNHLERTGLLIRRGHPPQGTYIFKHALLQDAAQSSLLHSEKKILHARIADVLSTKYPETVEREPELLAHHLTEAGEYEAAIAYWLKAGWRAVRAYANLEAIAHLRRGVELLQANPQIQSCEKLELELRVALGRPLIAAKGYAVPEVEDNYLRALELVRALDDKPKVFDAIQGLWVCYFIRGDLAKAHDLGAELLNMVEQGQHEDAATQDQRTTGTLIEAHRMLGQTLFYRGQFAAARDHLERGMALYDPRLHHALVETHGIDPGVICLSYFGYLQWFIGLPDSAREYSKRALSEAERMNHPFTLAFAVAFSAYLCQHLGDVEGTRYQAERTLEIATEHGFAHWQHQAMILRGWALMELGEVDTGLEQIQSGLEAYEATESRLASPWFRSLLAIAYARAKRPDAALRELDQALAIAVRSGEEFFIPEIYRLQGEIALADQSPLNAGDVEILFQQALDLGRQREALAWEVRSAVSLARWWSEHGKRQEAASLLASVLGKVRQGFDTADVSQAVELSNALKSAEE